MNKAIIEEFKKELDHVDRLLGDMCQKGEKRGGLADYFNLANRENKADYELCIQGLKLLERDIEMYLTYWREEE